MVHELPDACEISAKIKLLNYIRKAIEEELDWIMLVIALTEKKIKMQPFLALYGQVQVQAPVPANPLIMRCPNT